MVTSIYGLNDSQRRPQLWREIKGLKKHYNLPSIIGGDFNIVRFTDDRRGGDTNHWEREIFNDVINEVGSLDMSICDRKYTCSNMREDPSLTRLDRVMVTNDWEVRFPKS